MEDTLPPTARKQIILDFHALQRQLGLAVICAQTSHTAFVECDVSASLSSFVPLTGSLETAVEHCKAVTTSLRSCLPEPDVTPLPALDPIVDMLAHAHEALSTHDRFKVPRYNTDSETIAAQLGALLSQLGNPS